MGYLLPWGQMSYWGAQVIVSLFGAIPVHRRRSLALWIRGDYVISDATLNRFFAFHVIAVPLVLLVLVVVHILALHEVGSNNPDGVEIKKNKDAERHTRSTAFRSIRITRSRTSSAWSVFLIFFSHRGVLRTGRSAGTSWSNRISSRPIR